MQSRAQFYCNNLRHCPRLLLLELLPGKLCCRKEFLWLWRCPPSCPSHCRSPQKLGCGFVLVPSSWNHIWFYWKHWSHLPSIILPSAWSWVSPPESSLASLTVLGTNAPVELHGQLQLLPVLHGSVLWYQICIRWCNAHSGGPILTKRSLHWQQPNIASIAMALWWGWLSFLVLSFLWQKFLQISPLLPCPSQVEGGMCLLGLLLKPMCLPCIQNPQVLTSAY